MLLVEHTKYHKLGPKDLRFPVWGWLGRLLNLFGIIKAPAVMNMEVTRNTSSTGEQIHISVPIYHGDDRRHMMDRINMAYSILQERLEDENKLMLELNDKAQKRRKAKLEIEKLHALYGEEFSSIEKRQKKEQFDDNYKAELLGKAQDSEEAAINKILADYGFESEEEVLV